MDVTWTGTGSKGTGAQAREGRVVELHTYIHTVHYASLAFSVYRHNYE
jgi:hypothetical protein